MINFSCPKCNSALSVDESRSGKKGSCASCGSQITIPHFPGEFDFSENAIEVKPARAPDKIAPPPLITRFFVSASTIISSLIMLLAFIGLLMAISNPQFEKNISLCWWWMERGTVLMFLGVVVDLLQKIQSKKPPAE